MCSVGRFSFGVCCFALKSGGAGETNLGHEKAKGSSKAPVGLILCVGCCFGVVVGCCCRV